ncbi:cardiolipin synthase [Ornithinimicrobium sp.]|uniref:cardiolipin synthase n=1 Tax=Ornithinimicrobium sp. TaxID=1977084 RepID=UPI002B45EF2B|nr:cardiolipin synthase [Ornithinimicrobium sp.]
MDDWDASNWTATVLIAYVTLRILVRVVAPGFVPVSRRPSSGMAWVVLILLFPFFGLAAWWGLGNTSIGGVRRERQTSATHYLNGHLGRGEVASPDAVTPEHISSAMRLNEHLGAFPPGASSEVSLYPDYDDSILAMAEIIDTATQWVHAEFYITAWDESTEPFFAALVRATERGVPVRLLFDHLGTRGLPVYKELRRKLARTAIEWHAMLPVRLGRDFTRRVDLRNHRKILVIDGTVAVMGSQNMTEPGYNKPKNHKAGRKWVELTCRVDGALARCLDAVFANDWYVETGQALWGELEAIPNTAQSSGPGEVLGQVIPSGPGIRAENNLRLFTSLIYGARHRLSLTSPYFVPDESLLYAVTTAAQRGVDVELFVGEQGDQFMVWHAQRSYYQALLESGVKIYLYQAPLVLHSKHFSVDDDVVVIGSSNMDLRSFALNYEVSMMLTGREVVERVKAVEDGYRARSRLLTEQDWSQRSLVNRYLDNVMRLTAALQ